MRRIRCSRWKWLICHDCRDLLTRTVSIVEIVIFHCGSHSTRGYRRLNNLDLHPELKGTKPGVNSVGRNSVSKMAVMEAILVGPDPETWEAVRGARGNV